MLKSINRITIPFFTFLLFVGTLFPIAAIDLNNLDFLPGWGTLNDTHVRIRTAPNLDGGSVGFLNFEDRVRILDRTSEKMKIGDYFDYWYKIGKVTPADPPEYYGSDSSQRVDAYEKKIMEVGWAYAVFIDPDDTNLDRTLIDAVKMGHENDVTQILQAGADPSTLNIERKISSTFDDGDAAVYYEKVSALTIALDKDYTEIARLLLSYDADANAGNTQSPLSIALMHNHFELVNLLLAKGATPDSKTLFEAVQNGYLEMVKTLVSKGADLQSRGEVIGQNEGGAPINEPILLVAIRNDHYEIAKFLYENGAGKPDQYFFQDYIFPPDDREVGTWFEMFGDDIKNSSHADYYETIFHDYFGLSFDDLSPQWI
ncbi:MAG: ankyrin repeat domain-containing protein [Spirochaetales bacterium]|nr:ankyrin repeat domain-containing protein [Spirochaetales bacterium]